MNWNNIKYLHNVFVFISDRKLFLTKYISKNLTTSLESLYCQECSNNSDSTSISTIDIVIGGDHGQDKVRFVFKFILPDIHIKKLKSYVIKNTHIECDKDTYDVLNGSIVKQLNEEIKILMNNSVCCILYVK